MLQQILRIDGHIQNIYLAVYEKKLLLLDGCCRCDVPMVLDTIRHILGRELNELKGVIVTHMHADHAGGAMYLKQATGCQIISTHKQTQWYAGWQGKASYALDLSLSYYVAIRQGKQWKNLNYPTTLYPDIQVRDGQPVPMFEDWTVLETPGHTDRDLSVWHKASGKVYVADLILKMKNKYVAPFNIHLPDTYRQSVENIKALQPKLVLLAHGQSGYIRDQAFDHIIEHSPKHKRSEMDVVKIMLNRKFASKR